MLAERIAKKIPERFANRDIQLHAGTHPVVTIPPIHASWEPIEIWDDEDEATVHFGSFTHIHFGNYDEELTVEQREEQIILEVADFLENVFADKIEFFRMRFGGGGCGPLASQSNWSRRLFGRRQAFVWSGPVTG